MSKKLRFEDLIIYQDADFLAVNKPSGMASLHERIADGKSLLEIARKYNDELQLCHRLDRDTSGVLLLSKHSDAYAFAAMLFEKRKIKKTYHAVVHGVHRFEDFRVNLPLVTTRSGRSSVNSLRGKESLTIFNSIEHFEHYTLVEAQPLSGRLHQIRIHLASRNAPIVADPDYGGKFPYLSELKKGFNLAKNEEERPMISRFVLHAYSLEFEDMNGEKLLIKADYPKDFDIFLKQLRRYDASPG